MVRYEDGMLILAHNYKLRSRSVPVSKNKSILSISLIEYIGAVHFQLAHSFCDDCEDMCNSPSYHHQIRNINPLLLFWLR